MPTQGNTAKKVYERLTNLQLRTVRHSKAYDVYVLDLYYAGVLVKETAESLLGYKIPTYLKPPPNLVPQTPGTYTGGDSNEHDPVYNSEKYSYTLKADCDAWQKELQNILDALRKDVEVNADTINGLQSMLYETITIDGDSLAKPVSVIFSAIRCSVNVVDYAVIFKGNLINKGTTDNIRIGTLSKSLKPAYPVIIPIMSMGNTNTVNSVTIDTQGVVTLASRLSEGITYTAPVVRGYSAQL